MLSSDVKCVTNTTKSLLYFMDMLKLAVNKSFILFTGIMAICLYSSLAFAY